MHDQSQAEKGHIFMSPTHFAQKNILIGEVSGEWRDIPRTEEIKEKDSWKDYGLGMGDCQNGQRKGRKKKKFKI